MEIMTFLKSKTITKVICSLNSLRKGALEITSWFLNTSNEIVYFKMTKRKNLENPSLCQLLTAHLLFRIHRSEFYWFYCQHHLLKFESPILILFQSLTLSRWFKFNRQQIVQRRSSNSLNSVPGMTSSSS